MNDQAKNNQTLHPVGTSLQILLAHADKRVLRRIRSLFPAHYAFRVVGEAEVLEQALRSMEPPDSPVLLLLDPHLPDLDLPAFLVWLRRDSTWCKVPVVLLADPTDRELCYKALSCGADDYVLTTYDDDEMSSRISVRMHSGQNWEAEGFSCAGIHGECELAQERRRLLQVLEQSHASLEAVLRQMPAGVVIAEAPSGRVLMSNERMEQILHRPVSHTPDAEAHREWRGYHRDGERPYRTDEWPLARSIRIGEVVEGEQIELERDDGTRIIVSQSSAPVRDSTGRIVAGVAITQDVTGQVQAQQSLRQSEAQFRRLAERSTSGLFIVDLDGTVLYLNPTMARLLDITTDDVAAGRVNWVERTAPEYADLDAEAVHQIRQTGVSAPYEKEFITQTGRRVPVLIGGAMLGRGPEGQEIAAAFVTDLTPIKQTEAALRHSELRLHEVLENSRDAIYNRNLTTGRYDYISPAMEDLLGYTSDELLRMTWEETLSLIHPDDLAEFLADSDHLGQSDAETPRGHLEYRLRTKWGEYRWFSVSRSLVRNEQGEPVAHVGTIRDITERKEAEERLRQSEARFRTVLDNSYNVIYQYNPVEDRYEYVSPSIEQTMDMKVDGLVEMNQEGFLERLHPDDRGRFEQASAALYNDPVKNRGDVLELRWRMDDGSYRWFGLSRTVVLGRDSRSQWEVGVLRDITERKAEEEQILRLNEILEHRVAERTAIAERRAAQLRDLAAELMQTEQRERRRMAQTLHDDLQQLIAGAKLYLGIARGGVEDPRLNQLLGQVDGLLEQAVESSRTLTMELSPPVLHEGSLTDAMHWLAHWMRDTHDLEVEVRAAPDIGPVADEVRLLLFQSVRELLFNVVKHAGVNGAGVEVAQEDTGWIRVVVSDHGQGFAPDGRRDERQERGGFGLFSVRERVEWLGGQIEIESAPYQGTRVMIRVPANAATQGDARAPLMLMTGQTR
ncbi:MAG TPA: PAS domain S-box protein, partial [Chloroflexi bacterium]|nr:PAS domain S-box protein [Chloroflexota bacterium]